MVATQFWIIPFVISASWSYAAAEEGLIPQIESSQQKNDVAGSFRQPRFILGTTTTITETTTITTDLTCRHATRQACVADCAGAVAPGCNNVCAPTNCALTGRKRRAILDAPITGLYRPDNLMTPDDKARYIRSLKASDTSSNDSLSRNERDLEQHDGYPTELSSSHDPGSFRRGKFFAIYLVSTATSFVTNTAYSSTYRYTVDCTAPGPYTYADCP